MIDVTIGVGFAVTYQGKDGVTFDGIVSALHSNATGDGPNGIARVTVTDPKTSGHKAGADVDCGTVGLTATGAEKITVRTTVYAPWEEGQDEPEKVDEDTDVFTVADHSDDDTDDQDMPLSLVEAAARILTGDIGRTFYAVEPSSSPLTRVNALNTWWSAETYEHPHTATREEKSAHLSGFTPEDAHAVHLRVAAILRERFHITIAVA